MTARNRKPSVHVHVQYTRRSAIELDGLVARLYAKTEAWYSSLPLCVVFGKGKCPCDRVFIMYMWIHVPYPDTGVSLYHCSIVHVFKDWCIFLMYNLPCRNNSWSYTTYLGLLILFQGLQFGLIKVLIFTTRIPDVTNNKSSQAQTSRRVPAFLPLIRGRTPATGDSLG